jgi:four helix bundle protein
MKNFRTYQLAVQFYRQTQSLSAPSHLKSQLDRAASSIPLNLMEGQGRIHRKDKARFYRIAFGSIRECQAILELLNAKPAVLMHLDHLAASTYRLIQGTA